MSAAIAGPDECRERRQSSGWTPAALNAAGKRRAARSAPELFDPAVCRRGWTWTTAAKAKRHAAMTIVFRPLVTTCIMFSFLAFGAGFEK